MGRRGSLAAVAGAMIAVLALSVTTAGGVTIWQSPTTGSSTRSDAEVTLDTIVVEPTQFVPPEEFSEPLGWVSAIYGLFVVIFLASSLVVFLQALRLLRLRRPQLFWRHRPEPDREFEVLADVTAAVSGSRTAQFDSLMHGAARNAIVSCWLSLEQAVATAGLERDPAQTSAEFTTSVLSAYAVDPEPILALSALYREARFSDHELDESHRTEALAALRSLHDALSSRAGAPA